MDEIQNEIVEGSLPQEEKDEPEEKNELIHDWFR